MPRKFNNKSKTWQMFEKYFLELNSDKYPYVIQGLTKGQAINLTQGLNSCQQYWAQQRGVPQSGLKYSAKAKEMGDSETGWIVEISDSPKHTNTRKGALWLSELLNRARDEVKLTYPPQPLPEEKQLQDDTDQFLTWLNKKHDEAPVTETAPQIPPGKIPPGKIPPGYIFWGGALRKAADLIELINTGSDLARNITVAQVMQALEHPQRLVINNTKPEPGVAAAPAQHASGVDEPSGTMQTTNSHNGERELAIPSPTSGHIHTQE